MNLRPVKRMAVAVEISKKQKDYIVPQVSEAVLKPVFLCYRKLLVSYNIKNTP